MEEDIKILENYLHTLKKFSGEEIIKSDEIIKFIEYKEIKAIENLIKGYRELKEKNKLINVRIKTKLRIAQGNYERYEKDGEYRLALIQCGKVGTLQELLEGE